MGEVLILIIIVLIWAFKAAVANEDKKVNDRNPGGISAGSDELLKRADRTISDLDAMRAGMQGKKPAGPRANAVSAADSRRGSEEAGAKRRPDGKRPSPTEIKKFHEQRRADEWESSEERRAAERANSEKRWAAARRQQADAALVHGVHIDSCEGRLESLKVLYDAGILDREEYAQRVARVRRAHAQQ